MSSRQQPACHQGCQAFAETDVLVQLVEVLHAQLAEDRRLCFWCYIIERHPELSERLVEQALAEGNRLGTPQALEIVPDGAASLRRHDEVDPRRVGHRPLRSDDLNSLSVTQHCPQWSQPPIHLGSDTPIADVGMD